ncbi:HAD family hydrolase, partial [Bacillus mobilis]
MCKVNRSGGLNLYTTFLFDLDGTLTDPKEGI